ncbi:MAG: Crp/Fnr family transcriptional regulator [Cellulophaga sp.]|nr:Crp/Fnr family transcriptional regulator [Cellulophaga sp.]
MDKFKNEKPLEIKENLIEKNNHIYKPLNNNGFIYEIVSGAVKLGSYSEQGEEYVYDILQKGDFFGNLRYLNGQFFEFSKTLIDTKVRIYELNFFKKTITNDPQLSDWFISYLLKRWCISEKKMGNIMGNKIEERIAFLMNLLNSPVTNAKGEQFLLFDLLTQKDLGDLSGVTRQTIATIIKKKLILST